MSYTLLGVKTKEPANQRTPQFGHLVSGILEEADKTKMERVMQKNTLIQAKASSLSSNYAAASVSTVQY